MIQEKLIKCSICGGERFLSIPEYKTIVEGNYLRLCMKCLKKAESIGLEEYQTMDDNNTHLEYINKVRGVKDEH